MTTIAFQQLGDAVEFLADNLKNTIMRRLRTIASLLFESTTSMSASACLQREIIVAAIKALSDRHAEHSLRFLYERWEFPADRQEFKLGGHGKELGHIHVDFEITPAGWCLKEVWICR